MEKALPKQFTKMKLRNFNKNEYTNFFNKNNNKNEYK